MPEQNLVSDLERFVREQASRFGDVISYVPEHKEEVIAAMPKVAPKRPDVAISEVTLGGLEEKLAHHAKEAWMKATSLEELQSMISNCQKCRLSETRTKFVFGVGNPNAKVMV